MNEITSDLLKLFFLTEAIEVVLDTFRNPEGDLRSPVNPKEKMKPKNGLGGI